MAKRLEFYFDCSSPWTYLAFTRVHDVAERTKTEIVWKPILVGGVFNAVNQDVYERRANPDPLKAKYYVKDLEDWAHFVGIHIGQPAVFPVNSVRAMRGALVALEDGKLIPYARAVFEAYWGDLQDISLPEVLGHVVASLGFDPAQFLQRIDAPEIKAKLRANTDELIARGGFGSPTMFVNGEDMYFGNDRLPLVEAALMRGR
jgi:2-hydroxychromene-2-carboxylate isomerase